MTIRAVFFDMGGTIEVFRSTPQLRLQASAGIQQLLHQAGIELHLTDDQLCGVVVRGLERYKQCSLASMEELPPLRVWRDFVLAGLPVDTEQLALIAEDLAFFVETHFYERAMRPEMPEVLEAIQQLGLKIGLISNVNSRGQVPANLDKYGIRHYFHPVVLSSEYGRRKPDPAIFHHAARLANVPTSACVYVGDRIARDIVGSRKAGFRVAVQIRHNFEHGEEDVGATPDFLIERMTELPDILRAASDAPEGNCGDRTIRAILFDAGDILYHRPEKEGGFRAFLDKISPGPVDSHTAERETLTQQAYRGQIDQDEYREALLRLHGISEPGLIERGKQILEDDDNNVEFLEGVQETLLAIKDKGYLLGIVTDTANPVHAKLRWFESGGIGHIWDSFISSKEVGTRKPDPQIYCAALQQLGIPAEQAVFVGHKASELKGARAVGMKTIAFNYDEDAQADYFIEKFPDLLKVPIVP